MKILFSTPYPFNKVPSQRFRFEQYLPILGDNNFEVRFLIFYSNASWERIKAGRKGFWLKLLIKSYLTPFLHIFKIVRTDYLFIHRESSPIGPPILEWLAAKIFQKKIIYDFDDAIWLTDKTNESKLVKAIRWRSKVGLICKWSYKVSCGNAYLADYAKQFNTKVIINPTTIDTVKVHNPQLYNKHELRANNKISSIVIGWTGSHTTLKYLEALEPVLKDIENKYPEVFLLVIADRPPRIAFKNLIFKTWTAETEIADLMLADIGIMPLPDDGWSKGKCGFKALQYMALEIPAMVSPVGVNTDIVSHGIEGFHCQSTEDWVNNIDQLINNESLRKEMGKKGRQKVIGNYSVLSNAANFLSLFA